MEGGGVGRKFKFFLSVSYYSEQPTFDADGYVVDPANLVSMKEMVQEVSAANQMQAIEAVPVEDKVA